MRVTWVGHSSVVLDLDGVRVLTDPLLRPHAGLLRRLAPRPDPASWSRPDVVLLSHLHHDHAELRSLRMLPEATLMSAPENVAWLRRRRRWRADPLTLRWCRSGVGPRLSAGHLTPETAARAAAISGARFAIPVHWGTLHPPFVTHFARSWLELPGRRFAEAVAERAPGCTAVVLAPGQSWVAPA